MSNLTNPPGGGEPPDRYRNVGEQIQSFFDFAENNPDRAVPFFVNIWETQASLTKRALALQGLGVAAKHYRVKEAFADWDVLKDIAKEVKGKGEVSNDLTRWAAASALEAIGYSQQSLQHLEGGGFTEPLDRIRREIRDRKLAEINRIPRLNNRGETTAEYERNLEFWIYGPVEELFAGNDHSPNYQGLVKDVIRELHGRGVYLGLISPNLLVQAEALLQAGSIFKESAEIENFLYGILEDFLHNPNQEISFRINAAEIIHTARDLSRRLKTLSKLLLEERNTQLQEWTLGKIQSLFKQSAENEKFLYQPLEKFLLNSSREILLRINAAEIINTATDVSRRLKTFSKLLLEEKNPKLQEVVLRQAQSLFKRSAEIEEYLYQPLEEFLHNSSRETSLRINAAEIINTATDLNRRLKTLSKLLLEETELRNTAVRLLNPYKQELVRVELDAYTVLETLNFEYRLDQPELKDLAIPQIELIIASASQAIDVISARFGTAIEAAENLVRRYNKSSNLLVDFLKSKQDGYMYNINNWIQTLRSQASQVLYEHKKIEENQSLLKQIFSDIYRLDSKLYKKVSEINDLVALDHQDYENYSYHRCQNLKNILTKIKEEIDTCVNNQKMKIKQKASDLGQGIFLLIPIILYCYINHVFPLLPEVIFFCLISILLILVFSYYLIYRKPNKIEHISQQLSNYKQ